MDFTTDNPRRVLMIAYAFPPTGGPGVQRTAKFAKYLPGFGWFPTVWTAHDVDGLPRDATLCDELPPEVTVHPQSTGGGVLAMRRTLRGFANPRAAEGLAAVASRIVRAVDWRLESWMSTNLLPDDCIGWARRSVGPLMRQLHVEPCELIYSTFSPASNHWLALEIKRRTNLPWVADFRDLWTDDCRYREVSPSRRAAHRRLEQEVLETADLVIGVTDRQTEILAQRLPDQREKFITITNGFDPQDFASLRPRASSRSDRFVLAYVGRFDLSQTSDEWFAALTRFVEGLGELRARFAFRVVGNVNPTAQSKLLATGASCEFSGYVPHHEAIEAMCDADALLLNGPTGPNGDSVIRAKLFEYLASRRPILVVGPRGGECERIVRKCSAGVTAGFDETAILRGLRRLFNGWKTGEPIAGARPQQLQAYARPELTRRLAEQFDRLTGVDAGVGVASDRPLTPCVG